jgi:hypothetical protein
MSDEQVIDIARRTTRDGRETDTTNKESGIKNNQTSDGLKRKGISG